MSIRAVLFDLDNTLIFEDESAYAAVRGAAAIAHQRARVDAAALADAVVATAEAVWRASPVFTYGELFGVWWAEALWGEMSGETEAARAMRAFAPEFRGSVWRGGLQRIGVVDQALAGELEQAYIRIRRSGEKLDPDAEVVLAGLASGQRLALVSNGAGDVQREKLGRTPFGRYLSPIVISMEVGFGKPDPRIFQNALEILGVDAEDAVMVGDSLARDVAGAHAAGIRAVWIDRGGAGESSDAKPDARIERLSDLPAALDALARRPASPPASP
ncbi:MAG TPA: HAD family hydrolase [Candidatus Limnocylindria bacterium]|jgi:putative hydrolase of the HAD superfamily